MQGGSSTVVQYCLMTHAPRRPMTDMPRNPPSEPGRGRSPQSSNLVQLWKGSVNAGHMIIRQSYRSPSLALP